MIDWKQNLKNVSLILCKLNVKSLMLNGRIATKIENENMICTILFMLVAINMQYL